MTLTSSSPNTPPIPLYADCARATLIGRGPHCHVNIAAQDPATAKKISRRHALIVWDSAARSFRLCVLGLNGVVVNGVARFADDDDDDNDGVDDGQQHDKYAGIELRCGTVMEFPGGVRFEFMGERSVPPVPPQEPAKSLASSPMRALRLQGGDKQQCQRVQVEVQAQEQVDDALDAVQGLLTLAASSSLPLLKRHQAAAAAELAPPHADKENGVSTSTRNTTMPPPSSFLLRDPTSTAFVPPPSTSTQPPPLISTSSASTPTATPATRRDPLTLQLDDPLMDHMDVDTTRGDSAEEEYVDPDQTLPSIDILSTRRIGVLSPCATIQNDEPGPVSSTQSLARLPSTPPRRAGMTRELKVGKGNPNDSNDDNNDLSSSSSSCSDSSLCPSPSQADPHGPPPMPLPDILVESFTFCARSDLSLAELLAEIRANQVYFRTHPNPALWHAQVLETLESHRMFALRPRNKWLKRATQWYYDPDRDHDAERAARFREFGSAQPARRAKRRADTQYYVKDLTGKPVGGAARGAGGVRVVREEYEDDDDDDEAREQGQEDEEEEGSYARMDAGKRAAGSKRARTEAAAAVVAGQDENDMMANGWMPSSDATVPGSPVMKRGAAGVGTRDTGRRGAGSRPLPSGSGGKRKDKVARGAVSGVRLDLD